MVLSSDKLTDKELKELCEFIPLPRGDLWRRFRIVAEQVGGKQYLKRLDTLAEMLPDKADHELKFQFKRALRAVMFEAFARYEMRALQRRTQRAIRDFRGLLLVRKEDAACKKAKTT